MKNIQDYYKSQGVRTKVEDNAFTDFPKDIKDISTIIQGLLVHPGILNLYGLDNLIDGTSIKTVGDVIDKIKKVNSKSLLENRNPDERVVAICKHFSMFMCSVLREQGIPARTRCGFATYFVKGFYEDHWICEYWNEKENKWNIVDAQINDIQMLGLNLKRDKIDFTNLKKGEFFPAGILWKLYRLGLLDGNLCGYSLDEGKVGEYYIRGNMLRDFFALSKIEYNYSETNKLMGREYSLKEEELLILDKIADLTASVDSKFDELRDFYEENKDLILFIST